MKKPRTFASITAILRKNRTNKVGENPVCFRVTKDRKVALISTPYSSPKNCWDNKIQRPNGKHYNYEELDKYIEETLAELKMTMGQLSDTEENFSAVQLVDVFKKRNQSKTTLPTNSSITFKEFYEKLLCRMESKGQYKTRETYVTAVGWLSKFTRIEDLNFADVTYTFLEDLLAFIIGERESEGKVPFKPYTLFGYFKNYLAIMNKAAAERIFVDSSSNYKEFKLSQFKVAINPIAIPLEEMNKIIELKLEPFTSIWDSRNYFIFSFMGGGINFVDIAKLKKGNLRDGRIEYTRSKTGEQCKFKLNPKTLNIIDSYADKTYKDFLFPIFTKDYSKKQCHTRTKTASRTLNKHLKEIAFRSGIKTKLTFYVGRHSYATELKYQGFNDSAIGESLGHSSEKSIKNYLKRLPDKNIDMISNSLYESILAQNRISKRIKKTARANSKLP